VLSPVLTPVLSFLSSDPVVNSAERFCDSDAVSNHRSELLSYLITVGLYQHHHIFSTRNSSGDEIANVNFLYDDIVHVLQNTIDSCINSATDSRLCVGTHVYQNQ